MPDDSTSCPGCGASVTGAAIEPGIAEESGVAAAGDGPNVEAGAAGDGPNAEGDGPNLEADAQSVDESGADADDEEDAEEAKAKASAETASDVAARERAAKRAAAAAPPRKSNPMTKVIIVGVIAFIAAVGLIFWQAKGGRAEANLTAEDMALLAEGLSPMMRMQLANSPEERKKMSEELRKILAVAEEARREGIDDRPEVKRQLEAGRLFVIAQMYEKKQRDAKANPQDYNPKPEEIEAFLKEPGKTEQADSFLADLQKLKIIPEGQQITDEDKTEFRQMWARSNLLAKRGIAAGVDKDRLTQLQIRLQQAIALNRIYSEELAKKLEPTEEEINAKMEEARREAEDVLKRARAGEDFDALVKAHSDEPGAKSRGGELPWFGRAVEGQPGGMVKPFEDAAFALRNEGDISDIVETDFGYHIIKLLGRRTDKGPDGKDQEQVHASHVLIMPNAGDAESAGRMSAAKTLRDKVKESLTREKEEKLLKEIADRSKVKVPEDFAVKVPDMPQRPTMPPHGDFGAPSGEAPPPQPPADTKPKGDGAGKKK